MTSERPPGTGTLPSESADPEAGSRLPRPSQRPPAAITSSGSVIAAGLEGGASVRPSQRPARPSTFGEGRASLDSIAPDPALSVGAENAVVNCLRVQKGESVVACIDFDSDAIGAALVAAARSVGADVRVVRMGPGHARNDAFLLRLDQMLEGADVSMLVTTLDGLPVSLRRRIIHAPGTKRRHGHLVGVTVPMMGQSLRADPVEIERLGAALLERIGPRSELEVSAPGGTQLRVRCDPRHKWHHQSGLLHAPGWTNLPSGELLTTPLSVDGELVCDGGAWSPRGEEIPNGFRLRLRIEESEVKSVDGEGAALLETAMSEGDHGRRVGQVGLGTNVGVVASIGALLQDMKLPGFHLTLGSTYAELTCAGWDSAIEIPLLVRRANVSIDGVSVMVGGRYVPALYA